MIDNCICIEESCIVCQEKERKTLRQKVEEISKTGEYLRVKLPLNPTAREFKPDVKSKPVSDLPLAPASTRT